MEDLPSAELQPSFLCLQRRTCPWSEHSDDDDDDDDDDNDDDQLFFFNDKCEMCLRVVERNNYILMTFINEECLY